QRRKALLAHGRAQFKVTQRRQRHFSCCRHMPNVKAGAKQVNVSVKARQSCSSYSDTTTRKKRCEPLIALVIITMVSRSTGGNVRMISQGSVEMSPRAWTSYA